MGYVDDASPLFVDVHGDLEDPRAAIHSMNEPEDPHIAEVVAAGHLVRTRSDADVIEPELNDTTRRDTALASGATFVSTDFPVPHPTTGFVVSVGDGPARCKPVHTNTKCTPERLEPY